MRLVLEVAFLLVLGMSQAWGYSSGPPLSKCETVLPVHDENKPQSGASPYSISVSNSSYTTGGNLTVTIKGSGSKKFKGFILQARGSDSSVAWPIGEFTEIPADGACRVCFLFQSTAAHKNPSKTEWSSLQFTWTAPAQSAGNITFIATIVEKFDTFWRKIESSVVTGPPAENVTRGEASQSFQIDKTGCAKTKGCFSLPSDCTGSADCNYLFTYQVSGGKVVMEMSAKQRYVSVAFNEQQKMDKMDAIMCATMGNNLVELRHYYSRNHNLDRQNLAGNSDITLNTIVNEDGGIKCRVTRKLTSNAAHFKDLTKMWYVLFAYGTTTPSGSGQYHVKNRTFSRDKIDLSVAATLVDGQTQVKDTITKDGCGETKSCYSEPEDCEGGSDCSYLVTIKPVKGGDGQGEVTEVEFEISSKKQWASIGFNSEKKMGGTDALICENINGQVSVEHYVADKGYGTPTKSNPKPSSLVQLSQKSEGGIISCQFKRNMKDPDMIDLTEPLYLVYASGPISGDTIGKHPPSPNTSPQKVEVAEVVVLTGEKKDSTLMKAHGCLMVIAWIGFASIGIFMARFTRVAFGDKELLGTKVWFTFHRILMISTVLVTIVGIILIFVYAGRWMPGAHPIIGIIVLVLSVIQPIAAAFRPHPGDDNRYLFNWAHRAGGIFALILAVVTVFLGICIYKDELGLDNSPLYAMIVYCVGVAFVIAFDIYLSCKKRDHKTASFTMTGEKEACRISPPSHAGLFSSPCNRYSDRTCSADSGCKSGRRRPRSLKQDTEQLYGDNVSSAGGESYVTSFQEIIRNPS
ncbi:unnamed protein product [Porites evermanni]|uniref:Ferric-chelate reductase 1 n=1 Tax=Porites evermanni TaxID=104178 RepID=A0ABN8R4V1_9CNID|nr:unnamed protein product [Porites evermanni]